MARIVAAWYRKLPVRNRLSFSIGDGAIATTDWLGEIEFIPWRPFPKNVDSRCEY